MISFLQKNLSGITSSSIEKYLLLTGWDKVDQISNKRVLVFRNKEDEDLKIAVPANNSSPDFYARVYDLVQMLSNYLERPEQEIVDSLRSAFTDRIQFRIITESSKNGRLPLDYAARCLEGLKDLVLYAACAEEKARPVCLRTNNNAKSNMEKFQFEQTEVGSFIFNVGVEVASQENEQFYMPEVVVLPESKEHKIVKRIDKAIQQVNSVVNREIKISDLVEIAYEDGLTANICDAMAKLGPDEGQDITLETSIYYAEAITHAVRPPKVSVFDNVHFAFINELSQRFKDYTLAEDVVLTGTIKMLSKSISGAENEAENKIRLLTKIEGKVRGVDLILDPADHTKACNAYRDDREVRVGGTLDKSGKRWFFSEVTSFDVVE